MNMDCIGHALRPKQEKNLYLLEDFVFIRAYLPHLNFFLEGEPSTQMVKHWYLGGTCNIIFILHLTVKKVDVKCIDTPQLQVGLRLNLVEDVQIHKCMLDLLFLFKKKKKWAYCCVFKPRFDGIRKGT